ncbi:MAG: WD40 repeat domain-containing protein, partial [Desulfobacterales bacterium]
ADMTPSASQLVFTARHGGSFKCGLFDRQQQKWQAGWEIPQDMALSGILKISPDGRRIYMSTGDEDNRDDQVVVWDTDSAKLLTTEPFYSGTRITGLALHPGRPVMAAGNEDRKIIVWSLEQAGVLPRSLQEWNSPVTALSVNQSGPYAVGSADGRILWHVRHRAESQSLPSINNSAVQYLDQDGAGLHLAGTKADGTILLWDTSKQKLIASASTDHQGGITGLSVSRQGNFVATSGNDGYIVIYNGNELSVVRRFQAGGDQIIGDQPFPVLGLTFMPDESALAVYSMEGLLRFWHVDSGEKAYLTMTTGLTGAEYPGDVQFSADQSCMAWRGNETVYWMALKELENLTTGVFADRLDFNRDQVEAHRHKDMVTTLALSSNGRMFVSWGGGELLICEAGQADPIGRLHAPDPLHELQFAGDGQYLMGISGQGALVEFDLRVEALIQLARSKANRELSDSEMQRYGLQKTE